MRVTVVGAGYVGLVTGACFAELGHRVVCLEIDAPKLAGLQQGSLPIHEPGLQDVVSPAMAAGRLRFSGDYAEALDGADFAFIAVPTPPDDRGEADTSFVFAALRSILAHARPGLTIVTKSTVPVGTGDRIGALVAEAGIADVTVASNPEFLRQGSAVHDFFHPDRVVVGSPLRAVARRVAALYEGLDAPVVTCGLRSAELAKYAANAMLAAKISFMNEMASICECVDADIEEVATIVGMDRRIGPSFLKAGLGWGGSCFPKDVMALTRIATNHGCDPVILEAVSNVNARQRERLFSLVRDAAKRGAGKVGILGLAFKPETDDVRGSPALDVIGRLVEEGIHVQAHDPVATKNARKLLPNIQYCGSAMEVAEGCDAVVLATEWAEYVSMDWAAVRAAMRGALLFDGRNVLDPAAMRELGFDYRAFGRAAMPAPRTARVTSLAAAAHPRQRVASGRSR